MKKYLTGFWRSLPIQLFLLHFRRYQVFLVFWYILFATVSGSFMFAFGANSLYLAPEYFGEVSALSTAIVGFAIGVFIMSWNITTFILHAKNVRFLATTEQPFLKYCINNSLIPIAFLVYYLIQAFGYAKNEELLDGLHIFLLAAGFMGGLVICIAIAFGYFFGADKTIYYSIGSEIHSANKRYAQVIQHAVLPPQKNELKVDWFLSARLHLRKPRDTRHYTEAFFDAVLNKHHAAAVIAIVLSFVFLIGVGYTADTRLFQLPAAASITIMFAIVIATSGALALLLKSWSIPLLILLYLLFNQLYQHDIIDFRNKAYGLNYANKEQGPEYTREAIRLLANKDSIEADRKYYLNILENWKARQAADKPVMYMITTSGGGTRSAVFTMHVLQKLDSIFHGELMKQTLLINGASGGMLGAAYFRELYYQKIKGDTINLQDPQYAINISKDLLNPIFSSFVTRDLIGPVQHFSVNGNKYNKDRGYAFEQKLAANTNGLLRKPLRYYIEPEASALLPIMMFNSVINRDGRKMIVSTHPARFLMQPYTDSNHAQVMDPDAIDFTSYFAQHNALNLNILSALRMNATFPYVLPNVVLPTRPVIDVMDAGLRDNFGPETCLRFMDVFGSWFKANTSKVVLIQIRDRSLGDWEKPLEGKTLISLLTKPFLILQNNWFKLQDFYQQDQLEYMYDAYGPAFQRFCFQYTPVKNEATASLSFHLTLAEKQDIKLALDNKDNLEQFAGLMKMVGQ